MKILCWQLNFNVSCKGKGVSEQESQPLAWPSRRSCGKWLCCRRSCGRCRGDYRGGSICRVLLATFCAFALPIFCYLYTMKLNPKYKLQDVAGEKMVVVHNAEGMDLSKVIVLNSTAEVLWKALEDKEFTPETVAGLLVEKYELKKEKALCDAKSWINSLYKAGLIEM